MFTEDKYEIVRGVTSEEVAKIAHMYLSVKNKAAKYRMENGDTLEEGETFGCTQTRWSYSLYGDPLMETLLLHCLSGIEDITKLTLIPTYAYARQYLNSEQLARHKDRSSCEISATMNLGGDPWTIFLATDSVEGEDTHTGYIQSQSSGLAVELNPGDVLVYRGCDLEHWREPFDGDVCSQVFFHFAEYKDKSSLKYKFDTRDLLGLSPEWRRDDIEEN